MFTAAQECYNSNDIKEKKKSVTQVSHLFNNK